MAPLFLGFLLLSLSNNFKEISYPPLTYPWILVKSMGFCLNHALDLSMRSSYIYGKSRVIHIKRFIERKLESMQNLDAGAFCKRKDQ